MTKRQKKKREKAKCMSNQQLYKANNDNDKTTT